jgi:hypothetical protein
MPTTPIHISELYRQVNLLHEQKGLGTITEDKFLLDLTIMQILGHIKVVDGYVTCP